MILLTPKWTSVVTSNKQTIARTFSVKGVTTENKAEKLRSRE